MRLIKTPNYYVEDMLPYSVLRAHLRYDAGDAEELCTSYLASAVDYMQTLTGRTFCSSAPTHHENGSYVLDVAPASPILGTTVIYLDADEDGMTHELRNVTGDWAVTSVEYLLNNDEWVPLAGRTQVEFVAAVVDDPATVGFDETAAEIPFVAGAVGSPDYTIYTETYPVCIDFTNVTNPSDMKDRTKNVYRITLSGGDNVKDLPRQFRQAALLLVGHYDTQREAEYIGGITTEIKEGVQRLLSTVKVF